MEKDYSLLRPFDLEAAKAGELLIDSDYDAVRFVGAATKSDEVCVEINSSSLLVGRPEDLFMAPIAWVEGRPVYNGDVLWASASNGDWHEFIVAGANIKDGEVVSLFPTDGRYGWLPLSRFTWQKPKVKKSGWRIVDKDSLKFSKEIAEEAAAEIANAVVVYGEWEE